MLYDYYIKQTNYFLLASLYPLIFVNSIQKYKLILFYIFIRVSFFNPILLTSDTRHVFFHKLLVKFIQIYVYVQ